MVMVDNTDAANRINPHYIFTRIIPVCVMVCIVLFAIWWFLLGGRADHDKLANIQTDVTEVTPDKDFITFFGEGLSGISKLDTDKDGIPDITDDDDDNDGIKDVDDDDDDNDGVKDEDDPSTAILALLEKRVSGNKGDVGATGPQGVAGVNGRNGADGVNGANGADGAVGPAGATGAIGPQGPIGATGATGASGTTGPQGPAGTVGVVTDDGVISTTLTGPNLNVQLLLAAGSGLEKLPTGLSLTTACSSSQVLKWNSPHWVCANDNGGISYTAGNGISITGSTIGSILGASIDTTEIDDGTITTNDISPTAGITNGQLANSSITLTAGNGLTDGGSVALGGTTTINIGAGTGITVNSNDIAITTDGIGYNELADNLVLDDPTTTALGAHDLTTHANGTGNVVTNLSGTGDFMIQNNGVSTFQVQDDGNVYIGDLVSTSTTGSLVVLDSITIDPTVAVNGAMYYNSTTNKFRCYEAGIWKDCISSSTIDDTDNNFYFFDDFIGYSSPSIGSMRHAGSGSGNSTNSIPTISANHPGLYRTTTGTAANGSASFMTAPTSFILGGGEYSYETMVYIPQLSSSSNRYQFAVGMLDINNTINQTDAVAFVYDEGGVAIGSTASLNWQLMTSSNGGTSRTWQPTSVQVVNNTWLKLRVEVNAAGTLATYYINDTYAGTVSTNIPTGSARSLGMGSIITKTSGGTAASAYIDYVKIEGSFTTPR